MTDIERDVIDRVSDGVVTLGEDFRYTYANRRARELLGTGDGDLVGKLIWDAFPGLDGTTAKTKIERAMETQQTETYERYNEAVGKWFEVRIYPDEGGLSILFRDITERTEREKRLERYERIVETLPVGVGQMTTGEDGEFVFVNEGMAEMLDASSKADLIGRFVDDIYADDQQRQTVRERLQNGERIANREIEFETFDGDQLWGSLTATLDEPGQTERFTGVIKDITEQKRREQRLEQLHDATRRLLDVENEQEIANITSETAVEILDLPMNGVHLYDSDAGGLVPAAVSAASDELLEDVPVLDEGLAWDAFTSGDPAVYNNLHAADDAHNSETVLRSEVILPLGEYGVLLFSSVEEDAFDETDVALGKILANNVTAALEQIESERQLREREQRLERAEALFENAQDAFFVVDVEGDGAYRFERVNSAYESLSQLSADAIRGQTLEEVFGESDGAEIRSRYDDCIEREKPLSYVIRLDLPEPDSYWDSRIAPVVVDGDVVQIVGATRDVTEQKTYEAQLERQRDGLELLNEIVRHDIRNDLQVVASYAELLASRVDEEDREYVERILNNAETAVELTRSARDLAGTMLQTEQSTEPTPLRRTLLAQIDDIRTSYSDAIVGIDGEIPSVTVDADEMLPSVFRNVLKNAIQHNDKAVPEVTVSVDTTDEIVRVTIADNGPGIPDAQKGEVFGKGEKGLESQGTGIGLYLVNTLVEKYDGTIRVDDNEPEGAVVTVTLPRV